MKVLAIGAHPDDIEVNCAGTLALFVKQGDTVVMAHVCSGDKGHMGMPREELAKLRKDEARQSAELLGAG